MASRTGLLKRFDELIDLGKSLPEFSNSWSLDQRAAKKRWETASIFLLEKTFGKGDEYYRSFNDALRWPNPQAHITYGLSILNGAKEEIEKGFLFKIEHLVAADFFNSIIDQAEYLLSCHYKDVAAILGRVAIEDTLRKVARRNEISFADDIKLAALNDLLWKHEVYAKNVWRVTQGHIDTGNYAAHGEFGKYDEKAVEDMLKWIRETVLNL